MVDKTTKSEPARQAELSPEAYRVLREHGTERAFSNPLNNEKRPGMFSCAGCGEQLFSSNTKYDSGSGWPSFYKPLEKAAVEESDDSSHAMRRVEVHCAKCQGHLGHVFPDGPKPTGLRYCINGAALTFKPEGET